MGLYEFKAKQAVLIVLTFRKLYKKYPDNKELFEIENLLLYKLKHLKRHSIYSYIETIHVYMEKYPELSDLLPSPGSLRDCIVVFSRGKAKRTNIVVILWQYIIVLRREIEYSKWKIYFLWVFDAS